MKRSRRTTPPEIVERIHRETVVGRGPTEILRLLENDASVQTLLGGRSGGAIPSRRTIQYIAREVRPSDDSDTWSPATADPLEAQLVMPVLVALVRVGQMTSLTQAMAHWIARARRVAPKMEPLDVLLFAGRYLAAERSGKTFAEVDVALARKLAGERPPG